MMWLCDNNNKKKNDKTNAVSAHQMKLIRNYFSCLLECVSHWGMMRTRFHLHMSDSKSIRSSDCVVGYFRIFEKEKNQIEFPMAYSHTLRHFRALNTPTLLQYFFLSCDTHRSHGLGHTICTRRRTRAFAHVYHLSLNFILTLQCVCSTVFRSNAICRCEMDFKLIQQFN